MAKIEKYVKQVDYLWYHADITDEQLAEWKKAGYFNPELDEDAYQQYANWYNRQG